MNYPNKKDKLKMIKIMSFEEFEKMGKKGISFLGKVKLSDSDKIAQGPTTVVDGVTITTWYNNLNYKGRIHYYKV